MKAYHGKTTFSNYPPSSGNKPIFQMYPARGHVSIQDARDVFNLCMTVSDLKSRDAIYAMHGMDGEAVDKYLLTVEMLENMYSYVYKSPVLKIKKPVQKELFSFRVGPFTI